MSSCLLQLYMITICGAIKYSYHGNYLMIDEQLLLFNDAMSYCETNLHTTLATIHSQSNNHEAFHLCDQSSKSSPCSISSVCWIGGYDIYQNNVSNPQWIDGNNMNYTNFYRSYTEVSQFENKCIRMNTKNGWHPVDCNNCPTRFLCNNKNKTIKGTTPSPTLSLQQIPSIEHIKSCDIMESLKCTQNIQHSTNHTMAMAHTVLFIFNTDHDNETNLFQCKNAKLSIIFEDLISFPFEDNYLYVYINGKYVQTCHDSPGCILYVECMANYDLLMDVVTNVEITIIQPTIQHPICSDLSLNVNVSIVCEEPFIATTLPTITPTKMRLKSKTLTIYDKEVDGNWYSIILKETERNAEENTKYSVWFDFKNAMCQMPIFTVNVKFYNKKLTYHSNITITANNVLYNIYETIQQLQLKQCNDEFNIFRLDTYRHVQLQMLNLLQISTITDFIFDNDESCWYQFGLNITVLCGGIITDVDDNDLESMNKNEPIYGYIIGIFVVVLVCAICVCIYVKRNNLSPEDNNIKQQKDEGIEMNGLQEEGIENFNVNIGDRDEPEGAEFIAKPKHKKCKQIKLKHIEGKKQEYIGLNNDINDIKDAELPEHNPFNNNETPKAFQFNAE